MTPENLELAIELDKKIKHLRSFIHGSNGFTLVSSMNSLLNTEPLNNIDGIGKIVQNCHSSLRLICVNELEKLVKEFDEL